MPCDISVLKKSGKDSGNKEGRVGEWEIKGEATTSQFPLPTSHFPLPNSQLMLVIPLIA